MPSPEKGSNVAGSQGGVSAAVLAMRRLAAGEHRDEEKDVAVMAAALHDVVAPVFANLRGALGDDGCTALASRAFVRSEWEHAPVASVRGATDCEIHLEDIVAAIESHGSQATARALEAVLSKLSEILGRIIGDDMAIGIMDHRLSGPAKDAGETS